MSHLQLMQVAKPILEQNAEGGVYLMTSSVAVRPLDKYSLLLGSPEELI